MPALLGQALGNVLGVEVPAQQPRAVGGGSINEALRYISSAGPLFVKKGPLGALDMFAAEAEGLRAIEAAAVIRVPKVLGQGASDEAAFLVLEWIEFGASSDSSEVALGERLAQLHRVTRPSFGWHRNNTIGATAQLNGERDDWTEFFREQRLGVQLDLAQQDGAPRRLLDRGRRLCECMAAFFSDHAPVPSLLHGDLWSGNWRADQRGDPVIFDPAVYYGDREADIAMTHLFGGFGAPFYAAYHSAWPLDAGAEARLTLYNLYHVLNHAHLFGGGYMSQALSMIDRLLAECGH